MSPTLLYSQAEESLRFLVGTEGDSLPLMEINAWLTAAPRETPGRPASSDGSWRSSGQRASITRCAG